MTRRHRASGHRAARPRAGADGIDTARLDAVTTIGRVTLPNPVLTASGTAGLGAELAPFFPLADLGAMVTKSLSADPWPGNPAPRLYPLPAGMLNSVGLDNPGVAVWAERYLPALAATGARVVVSIWGSSVDDFRRAAAGVATAAAGPGGQSIVALEANISCPNLEDRRRMFAHSTEGTAAAVTAVAAGLGTTLPLWVKLSPNVTDLVPIASAALRAGAESLTLVNTIMGLAIDPVTGEARLGQGGGGLSGPALHPVAVRAVYDCRAAFPGVGIVGVGGVSTGEDAAELLVAGADAIAVGTATFVDPRAPIRVLHELVAWCDAQEIGRMDQLRARRRPLRAMVEAGGSRTAAPQTTVTETTETETETTAPQTTVMETTATETTARESTATGSTGPHIDRPETIVVPTAGTASTDG